jgi:glycosyltransferase involved in cell wall biosynthesis
MLPPAPIGENSVLVDKSLPHILVDLTPVQPGGENGGAKPLTVVLTQTLARLAPQTRFTLLTSEITHDELAPLDAHNVTRLCTVHSTIEAPSLPHGLAARAQSLKSRFDAQLPGHQNLRLAYEALVHNFVHKSLSRDLNASLLFCPFTAPMYHHPAVPTVCLVHDLQFLTYPEFFDHADRATRLRQFRRACAVARMLICPSGYVRSRIAAVPGSKTPRVIIIPHAAQGRLPAASPEHRRELLRSLGLEGTPFLLYPANFWRHKNHETLLSAFSLFRRRQPASPLHLVLTGAPGPRLDCLRALATELGLGGVVHFPGFVSDSDLAALYQESDALVFPSLYEGFGLPVMEAMYFGRPVLCSNQTALAEVAGDAALSFDPRSPLSLADAILAFTTQPELAVRLAVAARGRAAAAGAVATMGESYLAAFRDAVAQEPGTRRS